MRIEESMLSESMNVDIEKKEGNPESNTPLMLFEENELVLYRLRYFSGILKEAENETYDLPEIEGISYLLGMLYSGEGLPRIRVFRVLFDSERYSKEDVISIVDDKGIVFWDSDLKGSTN